MQERRYAEKEGCKKGIRSKGGMKERSDEGKEGYRKVGIQGRWDAGLQGMGCRTGGMQVSRDAVKEGCKKGRRSKGGMK